MKPIVPFIASGLLASLASAADLDYSKVTIFGDSLSDTGNVFVLTTLTFGQYDVRPKVPFYTNKRFTDGKDNTGDANTTFKFKKTNFEGIVWHEKMSTKLGLPVAKPTLEDTTNGTNYAFGGAETKSGNGSIIPALQAQVASHIDRYKNNQYLPSDSLNIFWGGGNDVLNAATAPNATVNSIKATGKVAATTIDQLIRDIAAKYDPKKELHVLWPNLPQLDMTPEGQKLKADFRSAARTASDDFRSEQQKLVTKLRKDVPNVRIYIYDIYKLFAGVIADPASVGLKNATDQMVQINGLAEKRVTGVQKAPNDSNPDEYLFWDQVHPTSGAHHFMGDEAAKVVPAPAGLAALILGGFGACRRRR